MPLSASKPCWSASARLSTSGRRLAETLALVVLTAAATLAFAFDSPTAAPEPHAAAPQAHAATLQAHAANPIIVGPIAISVPEGFVPAQTQKRKKSLITAWTRSVRDGSSKTLLQIEVIDSGKPESAEKQLRQALEVIRRRRANFAASPLAHIQLAGLPAVRASWNGSIGGYAVVGVVYSVIVKDRYVVKLLTQDLGNTPTDGIFAAMQAIESRGMS